VAGDTLLGGGIDERAHLFGLTRNADVASFVQHPNSFDGRLTGDVFDDPEDITRVVAHHRLARRAADDIGALGGAQLNQTCEMGSLEAKVPSARSD
jgi:hypothetical protein